MPNVYQMLLYCSLLCCFLQTDPLGIKGEEEGLSETGLFQNCWKQFLRSVGGQVLALLVTTFAALLCYAAQCSPESERHLAPCLPEFGSKYTTAINSRCWVPLFFQRNSNDGDIEKHMALQLHILCLSIIR